MKGLLFMAVGHFLLVFFGYSQCNEMPNLCSSPLGRQMSADLATEQLSKIYRALNLGQGYNIEVMNCNLGKGNPAEAKENACGKYILVDQKQFSEIKEKYFSHFFIIAHEFAHIALEHTKRQPRNYTEFRTNELSADSMAASIIKLNKGAISDCHLALDLIGATNISKEAEIHSTHPTREKRIQKIAEGFESVATLTKKYKPIEYTDYFADIKDYSFLEYAKWPKADDILFYKEQNPNLYPISILKLGNKYFSIWRKKTNLEDYKFYYGYKEYPELEIHKDLDKGYKIEFLEKIEEIWYAILFKSKDGPSMQEVIFGPMRQIGSDLEDYIRRNQYSVRNIIPDRGTQKDQLVLLLTKNKSYGVSTYRFGTKTELNDWESEYRIKRKYNYLYCYKYLPIFDQYFKFYQNHPDVINWSLCTFRGIGDNENEDDISEIRRKLDQGYFIDNITVDIKEITFTLRRDRDNFPDNRPGGWRRIN